MRLVLMISFIADSLPSSWVTPIYVYLFFNGKHSHS